jgi:hypothetical protein
MGESAGLGFLFGRIEPQRAAFAFLDGLYQLSLLATDPRRCGGLIPAIQENMSQGL